MDKVVGTGLKFDLHIHSAESSRKDGTKVKKNTLENIRVLIEKLNENKVNLCAITDHDTFSYVMYQGLKAAETTDNAIQKVLPGVEFSVCFANEGKESVIHVVTLFSDKDETKVKNLENILKNNKPNYNGSYKEGQFLALLREADMNTILIAHQKNTLTSCTLRKNDANSLGNQKFFEFVYTDYFEAFEFKNRRNEVLNKTHLFQQDLEQRIRFITGTDCHDWTVYPSETPQNLLTDAFPYTFAKCLPTFKGLVMAITDHNRLNYVNNFFNLDKKALDEIKFEHAGEAVNIPLSRGINAIIGDNSIGKSLMLHALTGYKKKAQALPAKVKDGYKKYLADNDIALKKQLQSDDIFCFDMQGEVRSKFEENKLNASEFLKEYFPPDVNPVPYRSILDAEIERMRQYLTRKFEIDRQLATLLSFPIIIDHSTAESMTFINDARTAKMASIKEAEISEQLDTIVVAVDQLSKLIAIKDDQAELAEILKRLQAMKVRYDNQISTVERENARIETVHKIVASISGKHRKTVGDRQKKQSAFTERTADVKSQIVELMRHERGLQVYEPDIENKKILPHSNQVLDYEFISKLNVDEISADYFKSVLSKTLKAGKEIAWERITESDLKDMLLRYDDTEALQFFKSSINAILNGDFAPKYSIISQGTDKYAEMSSGLDSKIYFDLLCSETHHDGVYLIDQPEDNISQKAIREYLLERFKNMGESRQVIMVTHNPQFIVNLDVDNLIFLSKDESGLTVKSGALEYECKEYNVLDIVAQNIDGGLDSIKKRWKRYEKTTVL
ncbi:MAG: AAA family ATPase [Christensenellaceae bacterium]